MCSFLPTAALLCPLRSGPSRLMGHSAVAYKDCMLVFGGGESQNSPNNCLWRFSFSTQSWGQVATLLGSSPPDRIHHCCAGLGPSYRSDISGPRCSLGPDRPRPFKNKCFPAPLTFLGSEGAIELETFSLDRCHGNATDSTELKSEVEKDQQRPGNCLTFENKAFRKQWSCTEEELLHGGDEDDREDGDITQHLPDLLLVLGGRPCSAHSPISMWQMTLTDS